MSTAYTSTRKEFPEDYKLSESLKKSTIRRLEDKLSDSFLGDITLGNNVLGRQFARDYLSYLKNGGDFDIEGYYNYVWDNSITSIADERVSSED